MPKCINQTWYVFIKYILFYQTSCARQPTDSNMAYISVKYACHSVSYEIS